MTVTIESSGFYRPLSTPAGYLENIVIFNEKESFKNRFGWLESNGKDVKKMTFDELPKKRKVDLNNKFSFLSKTEDGLTLFLYVPKIESEVKKEYETFYSTVFFKYLYFDFNGESLEVKIYDRTEENDKARRADEIIEKIGCSKIGRFEVQLILEKFDIVDKI